MRVSFSWPIIAALGLSVPLSVALGYSFGPLMLIPLLAAGTLAVGLIAMPTKVLAARWSAMSPASIFALDVALPIVALTVLHGLLFWLGAFAKLVSDLGV